MFGQGHRWWNVAITATSWTVLATTAAARLHPKLDTDAPTILVLTGGTSDILDGDSAAQVLSDFEAYANAARAAGAEYVVASTITPSHVYFSAPQEAVRVAVNASIRTSVAFDAVADLAAVPGLDDSTNATYYVDGLHWTAAGAQLAANTVIPVIDEVLESA